MKKITVWLTLECLDLYITASRIGFIKVWAVPSFPQNEISLTFPIFSEEIFQTQKAFWGSNDGTLLLFAAFNDTNVGTMIYPWFSSNTIMPSGGLTSRGSFPVQKSQRYPTPGTLNPEVTLWLLDISNLTDVQRFCIPLPASLDDQ